MTPAEASCRCEEAGSRIDAPPLAAELRTSLTLVAEMLGSAERPWWIIAGAAAALHGVAGEVGDVDVLLDAADARALLSRPDVTMQADGGSDRFRSAVFARWTRPPLTVEFMAGFQCRVRGAWQPVAPATRIAVVVDGARLFVPERRELAALFRAFGRPKDHARAALLEALTS